jgi:uncharacterized RDD family membrane protein YckC
VQAGPLGKRFVALLIDSVVPAAVSLVIGVVAVGSSLTVQLVITLAGSVILLAWAILVWWMFAVKAAGPGMRVMKLQLVGLRDGRPIGWGRFFLRWLVLSALSGTGIGLIIMLIMMVQHPRKQGWHDLLVNAVVIKQRPLAPSRPAPRSVPRDAGGPPVRSVAGPERPSVAQPTPASANRQPAAPVAPPAAEAERDPEFAQGLLAPTEVQVRAADEEDDAPDDGRPLGQGWVAVLEDGREISVSNLVLLGRNPQFRPGEDAAELIKVADETRTVSKTHLALGVDANGMFVMDRGSTNGSTVTNPKGVSKPCPAGDVVPVFDGTIVSFGDHWLEIKHKS